MKPGPFEYHAPRTVSEAVELMGSLDNAKALAGGQSLVPMMNFRYVMPEHVVDLNGVESLAGIAERDDGFQIGALTRQREIEFSGVVRDRAPLLQAALANVGHRQTRNRGTIGGSLAHADPAAELPAVAAVYDAVVEIAGKRGTRAVPMADFNVGFMTTAVEPDEILTAISFKPWRAGHGYSFQEFARRHGDFAVVGVAVLIELDVTGDVRRAALCLCGVGIGPVRLSAVEQILIGRPANEKAIDEAAALAGEIEATDDYHASANYRRHLARVLTQRALAEAVGRERPSTGENTR